MWYSHQQKTFTSWHWHTCPIALPVRRNSKHRRLLTVVSAISAHPFQPLRHQRNVCYPVVNCFTRQHFPLQTENICLRISFALSSFAHKKLTTKRCSSVIYPQARSSFWLLKPASEHACAHLLPRLSWSSTVLLPSDTHRKPITSIAFYLSYLLNLLRSTFASRAIRHIYCYFVKGDMWDLLKNTLLNHLHVWIEGWNIRGQVSK
jgi:hypothetical protein